MLELEDIKPLEARSEDIRDRGNNSLGSPNLNNPRFQTALSIINIFEEP